MSEARVMTGKLFCQPFKLFAATVALTIGVTAAVAQSTDIDEGVPTRYPETGIAILDCAPESPAPEDSCVVRVPPKQLRGSLRASYIGDTRGKFEFSRPGHSLFPSGVTLSETLILVDITPGPQGGRRATFNTEKALIRQFVENLPAGESIAVYGFGERLERLSDFNTDRSATLGAIDGIELSGTNTRISTFTRDAIGILAERESALLKTVFVISDGDEEGVRNAAEVTQAAVDANVSVSALGTFWRPVGAAATASGMDYLRSLTDGTLGASVQLQLRRADDAQQALTDFQSTLNASFSDSGLIIPEGTPQAADVFVIMKEPVIGVANSYRDVELRVRFTPMQTEPEPAPEPEEPAEPEGAELFGYPASWVYAGGAALILLLGLILFALLKSRSKDAFDDELGDASDITGGLDLSPDAGSDGDATSLTPKAPIKAPAYLVDRGGRSRLPLAGTRVSLGRGSTNMLVIDHDSVSRVHVEIVRNRDGGYSVTDLDSLNGTFVNGNKIKGVSKINPGDEIKFGEVTYRLTLA